MAQLWHLAADPTLMSSLLMQNSAQTGKILVIRKVTNIALSKLAFCHKIVQTNNLWFNCLKISVEIRSKVNSRLCFFYGYMVHHAVTCMPQQDSCMPLHTTCMKLTWVLSEALPSWLWLSIHLFLSHSNKLVWFF